MGRGEVGEYGGEVHVAQEQVEREEEDGEHDLEPANTILELYMYVHRKMTVISSIGRRNIRHN